MLSNAHEDHRGSICPQCSRRPKHILRAVSLCGNAQISVSKIDQWKLVLFTRPRPSWRALIEEILLHTAKASEPPPPPPPPLVLADVYMFPGLITYGNWIIVTFSAMLRLGNFHLPLFYARIYVICTSGSTPVLPVLSHRSNDPCLFTSPLKQAFRGHDAPDRLP